MRNPLKLLLLAVLLTPTLGLAQGAFDGTWKVNLSTAKFPEKPDEYLLKDGIYQCKTCVPPIEVKADGKDQKVTGHPYFDTLNVKVVSLATAARQTRIR